MSVDIPVYIESEIREYAQSEHITTDEAIVKLIHAGLNAQTRLQSSAQVLNGKTPAEMLLGLFSSSDDSVLIDEVTKIAYEGRNAGSTRDIGITAH